MSTFANEHPIVLLLMFLATVELMRQAAWAIARRKG